MEILIFIVAIPVIVTISLLLTLGLMSLIAVVLPKPIARRLIFSKDYLTHHPENEESVLYEIWIG